MPKHHPLVSIITPVKNASVYLTRAIHSGLTQTYQNFEVIVVVTDDWDYRSELHLAGLLDPRVRLVLCCPPTADSSSARNVG